MKLQDIILSYGKKVVARDINAELLPGELVCLVGRNGAGKSTLIRHILSMGDGVRIKDDGVRIKDDGVRIKDDGVGIKGEVSKLISVVLTDRVDIERMTVRNVVAMGRMPYTGFFGILNDNDSRIVNEAMKTLGIEAFAERLINTLSDGERQKVMIAKALAQETPYILLDEPTAFLDHPSKVSTMQLLSSLAHEHHKAILISTHDIEVSLKYCDKIWWMKDGTLLQLPAEGFSAELL
jgi:iron complex transport system ATP-binding protein